MPKHTPQDTIVALATPEGRGALGIIRLSGTKAIALTQKLLDKKIDPIQSHTVHLRQILMANKQVLDQVVVTLFVAPRSYTGEDVVEISCHGSPYIIRVLLHQLCAAGARLAAAGEFTKRAFAHGKLDLVQAEAVCDVIEANNIASHRLAMGQLHGKLSNQIQAFREKIIDFAGLLELELDFSEENIVFAQRSALQEQCQNLRQVIAPLLEHFYQNQAIRQGIQITLAGPPNAGKSTLFNALLQTDKAIVSEQAGTTRDYLEATHWLHNIPIRLFDTAGMREATQYVEKEGVKRTKERIQAANIVLWVFDLTAHSPQEVAQWQHNSPPQAVTTASTTPAPLASQTWLFVGNKQDKLSTSALASWRTSTDVLLITAQESNGIDLLKEALAAPLGALHSNTYLLSNLRHYQLLQQTQAALVRVEAGIEEDLGTELLAADLKEGLRALGELLGDISTDEVLGRIFSRFCIGK